jgi:hypothetical protein
MKPGVVDFYGGAGREVSMVEVRRLELLTFALQRRCSTN